MIGLTPSCSCQVKGDGKKVKQSELELHKRMGRGARGGGGFASPPVIKKTNLFGQNWSAFRALQKRKENLYLNVLTYRLWSHTA